MWWTSPVVLLFSRVNSRKTDKNNQLQTRDLEIQLSPIITTFTINLNMWEVSERSGSCVWLCVDSLMCHSSYICQMNPEHGWGHYLYFLHSSLQRNLLCNSGINQLLGSDMFHKHLLTPHALIWAKHQSEMWDLVKGQKWVKNKSFTWDFNKRN